MSKLKELYCKCAAKLTTELMSLEWTQKEKTALATAMGVTTVIGSTAGAYAAVDMKKQLENILSDAYGIIFGVSTGIAIVFVAWHLICMMTTGDPQTTRMHVQACKKIAIAWVVLNCLGVIATTAQKLTSGASYKF